MGSTRGASSGPRAPGGLPPSASCSPHLHEGPPLAPVRQVDCLPLPPALLIYMRVLPWPPCARWTASFCLLLSSYTLGSSPGPPAPGGLPPSASCSPHLHEGPPLAPVRQVDCLPLPPALLIYMRGLPWPPCAMWTASLFLSPSSLSFPSPFPPPSFLCLGLCSS